MSTLRLVHFIQSMYNSNVYSRVTLIHLNEYIMLCTSYFKIRTIAMCTQQVTLSHLNEYITLRTFYSIYVQ